MHYDTLVFVKSQRGDVVSKLKGVSPEFIEPKLKAFLFGESGTGKTLCCANFPKPYFIDTEKGAIHAQYVEVLKKNGGSVFHTTDFMEVYEQARILASDKHDYQTLVIDSITPIYFNLLDYHTSRYGSSNNYNKNYTETFKEFERLGSLLTKMDMNVILTARSKKEFKDRDVVSGRTFDAYKNLPYLMDLYLELKVVNNKYLAVVKKSRIASMSSDTEFDFNYQALERLYSLDKIKKESVPINFVTKDTLHKLRDLINILNISSTQIDRWKMKEGVSVLEDMEESRVKQLIQALETRKKNLEALEVKKKGIEDLSLEVE